MNTYRKLLQGFLHEFGFELLDISSNITYVSCRDELDQRDTPVVGYEYIYIKCRRPIFRKRKIGCLDEIQNVIDKAKDGK